MRFKVICGPNEGRGGSPTVAKQNGQGSGVPEAQFTYADANGVGTDLLSASTTVASGQKATATISIAWAPPVVCGRSLTQLGYLRTLQCKVAAAKPFIKTVLAVGECTVGVATFLAPAAKLERLVQDADKASTAKALAVKVGVSTPLGQFALDLAKIQEQGVISFSQLKRTIEDAKSLPDFLRTIADLLGSAVPSLDVNMIASDVANLTGLGPCVALLARVTQPTGSETPPPLPPQGSVPSQPVPPTITPVPAPVTSGTPPDVDRPAADIPVVPQALWTEPMGAAGEILPSVGGTVVTTKCSFSQSTDADVPYALQDVATDGSLNWRRGDDTSGCWAALDSTGDVYYLSGDSLRSVDTTGHVRWITEPLSQIVGGSVIDLYTAPVVGANGTVYIIVYLLPSYEPYLVGVSANDGSLVVDQDLGDGLPGDLYAYSDGLIVTTGGAGGGDVEYYNYAGQLQARYAVPGIDLYNFLPVAQGANGALFVDGQPANAACQGEDNASPYSVAKITPSGVAWVWTDPETSSSTTCSTSYLAATPDGGVVAEEAGGNSGAASVVSLGSTGTSRWNLTLTAPGGLGRVLVDVNGLVVLPSFTFEEPCGNACTDLDLKFVSEASDADSLSPLTATDTATTDGASDWGWGTVAIAPNRVYASASPLIDVSNQSTDAWGLAALQVTGLSEDYAQAVQPG
jgi:hypothetical protein